MSYANLVNAYLSLNQLDQAVATARQAQAHGFENPQIHISLYAVDFLRDDAAGMDHDSSAVMGKPGWEDTLLYSESETAAFHGQFTKARALMTRAVESAKRADKKEAAAACLAESAVREAWVGDMATADSEASAVHSGESEVTATSALALGLVGEPKAAQVAAELEGHYPEDTILRSSFLPAIHAALALRGNDPEAAIRVLQAAAPYELAAPPAVMTFKLYPVYLRGLANLLGKHADAAATDFQKVVNHPGVVQNEPIGALAYLGLGRAYVLSGDRSKARSAYQVFFALWQHADPDIPVLKQAKAEYAKLNRSGTRGRAQLAPAVMLRSVAKHRFRGSRNARPCSQQLHRPGHGRYVDVEHAGFIFDFVEVGAFRIGTCLRADGQQPAQSVHSLRRVIPQVLYLKAVLKRHFGDAACIVFVAHSRDLTS